MAFLENSLMVENILDKKKLRMPELDVMKFIGIILVVAGHVTRMYTPQGLIPTIEHNNVLEFITNVIYSFHMPNVCVRVRDDFGICFGSKVKLSCILVICKK